MIKDGFWVDSNSSFRLMIIAPADIIAANYFNSFRNYNRILKLLSRKQFAFKENFDFILSPQCEK
jgi:hypothetical protein